MSNSNNAFFETFEQLINEHGITIDRPKGTAHPRFQDLIYPIDYGYINNTQSQDGGGIDLFLGDDNNAGVVGIICTIDATKRDSEVKVLYNCTEENIQTARRMMNNGPMCGILIRK
ncbi:MAG: inorganic pyrophosphatase [Oscillospiraceae bacterium]|jgi:inorganic pyrophosphatase|nr:inorganic pyrophosphatase [Oscillospiraceae bacterium]